MALQATDGTPKAGYLGVIQSAKFTYQRETVGNSSGKGWQALKRSVHIKFYMLSTMPLSKWSPHDTVTSLWGHM